MGKMEYFIMRQDRRYTSYIEPLKMKEGIDQEAVKRGSIQYLDHKKPQMFYIKEKNEIDYIDYLDSPFSLVSDQLWQLFNGYEKRIYYKPIVIADAKRMRQDYYWLVLPEILDCLAEQTEFNKDHSLKKIVIDTERVGYCKIFKIEGILEDLLVIDLDVAEEILANDFRGILFEKVHIKTKCSNRILI